MPAVELAVLKSRRGAIKASITKHTTKIAELETKELGTSTPTPVQQLAKRLDNLDSDFKTCHFVIVNIFDEKDQLAV